MLDLKRTAFRISTVTCLLAPVLVTGGLAGEGLLTFSSTEASDCQRCKTHGFLGWTVHHFGNGDNKFQCAPNTCHPGDDWNSCADMHYGCDDALAPSDLDHLVRLLASGDVTQVYEMAAKHERITLDLEARAVLGLNCDGGVMAYLPFGSAASDIADESLTP